MKLLTVNPIIELQSSTFIYKAFKGQLPVNLQSHFNLNTGSKDIKITLNVNILGKKNKKYVSFIGVKLWNKTDKWILNSYNIHMFKKKHRNYLKQTYMRNSTYKQI